MKQIMFMRHGKSSWANGDLPDHDRPLNERGNRDAHAIGSWLAHQNDKHPQILITSSAKRALQTAKIVQSYLPNGLDFDIRSSLYTFSIFQLIDEIKALEDDLDFVMLFGHNPAYTALYNYLTDQEVDNMPTAALAHFQLDITHWNEISDEKVISGELTTPKKLRS